MIDWLRVVPKTRKVKIGKTGIIFNNPSWPKRLVFGTGTWLVVGALGYLVYLYYPLGKAVYRYMTSQQTWTPVVAPSPYPTPTIETNVPSDSFEVEIPKILAKSKIIESVSPFEPGEYLEVLKNDEVAQAKGSSLPGNGLGTTTYLFAHSTQQGVGMVRKNAVFYLLGELKNDDVIFIRYSDKIFTYRVYQTKVVEAKEIEYLNYNEPDKELLIMQTCWPLGTDWKRLLVFAKRVDY